MAGVLMLSFGVMMVLGLPIAFAMAQAGTNKKFIVTLSKQKTLTN